MPLRLLLAPGSPLSLGSALSWAPLITSSPFPATPETPVVCGLVCPKA